MSSLIIYASPNDAGHNSTFLEEVKNELKARNEPFKVIDLYKDNYNPILQPNELYTTGSKEIAPENIEYQKMITEAKSIVIIYPIWWQNMPAILKGFLDKVLTRDFAFHYPGKIPKGSCRLPGSRLSYLAFL